MKRTLKILKYFLVILFALLLIALGVRYNKEINDFNNHVIKGKPKVSLVEKSLLNLNAYEAYDVEKIDFSRNFLNSLTIDTEIYGLSGNNQYKVTFAEVRDKKLYWMNNGSFLYSTNIDNLKNFKYKFIGELLPDYKLLKWNGGVRGASLIDDRTIAIFHTSQSSDEKQQDNFSLHLSIVDFINMSLLDSRKIANSKVDNDHAALGGGMYFHSGENTIYLTVGASHIANDFESAMKAQDDNSNFGKILKITLNKDHSWNIEKIDILSKGLRNPQGLTRYKNEFFSVEHGPKGGDEINLLKEGKNYGWPLFSFGSNYDGDDGSLMTRDPNLIDPVFHFTPSIGISDIDPCPSFFQREGYKSCLLVSAMKDKSFRLIKFHEGTFNVNSVETIKLDARIRELVAFKNQIILFTESFDSNDPANNRLTSIKYKFISK